MNTLYLAILLRGVAGFLLMLIVVAPIVWLLYKLIPDSRLKIALFRVRSGNDVTPRDKMLMAVSVLLAYVFLAVLIGLVSARPSVEWPWTVPPAASEPFAP